VSHVGVLVPGKGIPAVAVDGSFDSREESVRVQLNPAPDEDINLVFIRGRDSAGNWSWVWSATSFW
jgi:hypothetical protein